MSFIDQRRSAIHPRLLAFVSIVVGLGASHAGAQQPTMPPAQRVTFIEQDDRSGPRFGIAYLVGGSVTLEKAGKTFSPLTSLFGWQFEHPFEAEFDLATPVAEVVLLVGGMEQGRVLPSMSWLLGLRQLNGLEFAAGPTVTGAGLQLAFAGGVTRSYGRLNVPVNLAVAPGRRGAAVSLTAGFNYK